jgi:hypothetical protein
MSSSTEILATLFHTKHFPQLQFQQRKTTNSLNIEYIQSQIVRSNMASNTAADLPPEAIAFATQMYDAARAGQLDVFQQALPAGLPANMTNEKGDSLVC